MKPHQLPQTPTNDFLLDSSSRPTINNHTPDSNFSLTSKISILSTNYQFESTLHNNDKKNNFSDSSFSLNDTQSTYLCDDLLYGTSEALDNQFKFSLSKIYSSPNKSVLSDYKSNFLHELFKILFQNNSSHLLEHIDTNSCIQSLSYCILFKNLTTSNLEQILISSKHIYIENKQFLFENKFSLEIENKTIIPGTPDQKKFYPCVFQNCNKNSPIQKKDFWLRLQTEHPENSIMFAFTFKKGNKEEKEFIISFDPCQEFGSTWKNEYPNKRLLTEKGYTRFIPVNY